MVLVLLSVMGVGVFLLSPRWSLLAVLSSSSVWVPSRHSCLSVGGGLTLLGVCPHSSFGDVYFQVVFCALVTQGPHQVTQGPHRLTRSPVRLPRRSPPVERPHWPPLLFPGRTCGFGTAGSWTRRSCSLTSRATPTGSWTAEEPSWPRASSTCRSTVGPDQHTLLRTSSLRGGLLKLASSLRGGLLKLAS